MGDIIHMSFNLTFTLLMFAAIVYVAVPVLICGFTITLITGLLGMFLTMIMGSF